MYAPPIEDLIHDGAGTFPFPGWADVFGDHCWFYAAGYLEVRSACGLHDSDVGRFCSASPTLLPKEWKTYFKNGQWSEVSTRQIGFASDRKPQRFDKALLCLLALGAAILDDQTQLNEDCRQAAGEDEKTYIKRVLWDIVSIRPALYKIKSFDRKHIDEVRAQGLLNELRNETPYINGDANLYNHIADGFTVTFVTATNIVNFLKRHRIATCAIERITQRNESGVLKRTLGKNVANVRVIEKPVKSPSKLEFVCV